MRRVISFILLSVLFGGLVSAPVAQAGNDLSWIPTSSIDLDPGVHGFAFTDKSPLPFNYSVLQADSDAGLEVCTSTSDAICGPAKFMKFNSILKVCTTTTDTNCIQEVNAIDATDKSSAGTFQKYTVTNHLNAYPGDLAVGIPAGDMPSIWSIPSAPHVSGNDYAVIAGLSGDIARSKEPTNFGTIMQISLVPVVLKDYGTGKQSIAQGWTQSKTDVFYDYCTTAKMFAGKNSADCNHVNGPSCILPTNDQGKCYAEEAFGAVQKFNLKVRLAQEPTGWMHGRMVEPNIQLTPNTGGGVTLSVTAGTTNVPMVYQNAPWDSLTATVQNAWVKCYTDMRLCGEFNLYRGMSTNPKFETLNTAAGQAAINSLHYVNSFGALPLEIMSAIAPLVGDKSNLESSTWSLRTLSNFEMNGSNKCFTSTPGIKGIVTTNSTAYSAGPPEFSDGSLNYQVAAPHFMPDGKTPFKGNYNLVMRSDVARCIYGFSSAPIKASISIISSEGKNDVATSVTTEKNGWLYLSANNFQFSAPVIKVKLSQDAPAVVAPKVKPQITVICQKGNSLKKVKGSSPSCPKGYKKK